MTDPKDRLRALHDALATRILVLDGAMGTMLHQQKLTDDDGPALDGCMEYLVKSRPEAVVGVHRAYLEAGSDIIETNSFGSTSIVLAEFGLQGQVHYFNAQAAKLARQAADEFSTTAKPRWVAGSMGPTTKVISVGGGITFSQLRQAYYEQAKGLIDGGADILLLETCNDTRAVKAGLLGIAQLKKELGRAIPVMVSGTIEATGTMLAGQTADAFWTSICHADLLSVGLNCATGPEFMTQRRTAERAVDIRRNARESGRAT
jgi:5-methyltetrahydrofolate--homocysteine methyltransferase